jgi:hypothetical protein
MHLIFSVKSCLLNLSLLLKLLLELLLGRLPPKLPYALVVALRRLTPLVVALRVPRLRLPKLPLTARRPPKEPDE